MTDNIPEQEKERIIPTIEQNPVVLAAAAQTLQHLRSMRARAEKAEKEAIRDPLTGLYNRRELGRDLLKLENEKNYAIFFMDIDNFKTINDVFGHDIGDLVLIDVARAAQESSRGEQDRAYRYGGEEIAVVFRGSNQNQPYLKKQNH